MAALLADAQLGLVTIELAGLVTNASALTALGANEVDVRSVDRSLLRNDAALLVLLVGLNGLLDDGDALDNDLALLGERAQNDALLTAILAGEHLDLVALLDDIDIVVSPLR